MPFVHSILDLQSELLTPIAFDSPICSGRQHIRKLTAPVLCHIVKNDNSLIKINEQLFSVCTAYDLPSLQRLESNLIPQMKRG